MEDKKKICDLLLPTLKSTSNLSDLTDLEYIHEQGQVVATIGSNVKRIEICGYTGSWFIERIIDVLTGVEE